MVDFLTYVLVPAYAIMSSGRFRHRGDPGGIAIVISSRALFCRPQHEVAGQQLPRVSGAVERCGVLSVLLRPDPWIAEGGHYRADVLTFAPLHSSIPSGSRACAS